MTYATLPLAEIRWIHIVRGDALTFSALNALDSLPSPVRDDPLPTYQGYGFANVAARLAARSRAGRFPRG